MTWGNLSELAGKGFAIFFTAMAGALFGAASACWSDWFKENRKRKLEEQGAIVRTQLALIGQYNTLCNLRKQHLDAFKNDPQREFKLISFHMTDTSLRVAYDSLSFLLMTANPNLVPEVHAAEQAYLTAMEVLALRNEANEKLHKNSKLQNFDLKTGQCNLTVQDPRDIKLLQDFTNHLYLAVDDGCEKLKLQIEELHRVGKSLYPKKKFIKLAGEKT